MDKLVSLIIPCYYDATYIEKVVNSALSETYKNTEIIVVDEAL
ncbi:glycosyltransferase [Gillisia sp. Hel_I_29]|nr:glycosyltransferase [Gillisia sp. Hel_I_29]